MWGQYSSGYARSFTRLGTGRRLRLEYVRPIVKVQVADVEIRSISFAPLQGTERKVVAPTYIGSEFVGNLDLVLKIKTFHPAAVFCRPGTSQRCVIGHAHQERSQRTATR